MQITAKDVTTYIQEALTRLRELCSATLTGFDESMTYGGRAIRVTAKWK